MAGVLIFLIVPVVARAETAGSAAACPRIAVHPDATVIGLDVGGGEAMADVYTDDPNAPLSVIDVEVEPGHGLIFVVAVSSNATVWRFSDVTRRVAGALIVSGRSITTRIPTSAAVTGLDEEIVTVLSPGSCPLRAYAAASPSQLKAQQELFVAMSGRKMDTLLDVRLSRVSKISVPSGAAIGTSDDPGYRYPGAVGPDLAPEAARLWLEFLTYFPGGLVDIDPDSVVSTRPGTGYERLPGLLGLAESVSEGALELTGTPEGLADWLGRLGEDWVDVDFRSRLQEDWHARRRDGSATAEMSEAWWWLHKSMNRWTPYVDLNENPEASLHGNRFHIDGNDIIIEDTQGTWVPLETIEFIIRGPFAVPPATPASTHRPMFLLPAGVPEPAGPFRRELPLLREAAD